MKLITPNAFDVQQEDNLLNYARVGQKGMMLGPEMLRIVNHAPEATTVLIQLLQVYSLKTA